MPMSFEHNCNNRTDGNMKKLLKHLQNHEKSYPLFKTLDFKSVSLNILLQIELLLNIKVNEMFLKLSKLM